MTRRKTQQHLRKPIGKGLPAPPPGTTVEDILPLFKPEADRRGLLPHELFALFFSMGQHGQFLDDIDPRQFKALSDYAKEVGASVEEIAHQAFEEYIEMRM